MSSLDDPWENLSPRQALVTEVLAARLRLGEQSWTFPVRCRRTLKALAKKGLLTYDRGWKPRTLQARLTDEGKRKMLTAGYTAPLTVLLDEALLIIMYGRRVPGDEENWRYWGVKAEALLHSTLPPEPEEK